MRRRGFTLIEVLVSLAIVTLIGMLIYAAFFGMARSRTHIKHLASRYHEGRSALTRISNEMGSAFISLHVPVDPQLLSRETIFVGTDRSDGDRIDMTSFAHRRLKRDSHESDQAEISFFVTDNPSGGRDLVRRIDKSIDMDARHGGIVQVLAENIEHFDVQFLDPISNEWIDSWDSTQPAAQLGRLPVQVAITLVLVGGGNKPIIFRTKAPIAMLLPLGFANN